MLAVCSPIVAASDLESRIRDAAPDQIFFADMSFDRPVRVGELRGAVDERSVPRVLAYIEREPLRGRPAGHFLLGMGEFYSGETARKFSECKASVYASGALAKMAIDEWPVDRIIVHADAFNLRELINDTRLGRPVLTEVSEVLPRHLAGLAAYTAEEVTRPLNVQRNTNLPAYCNAFREPLDAPFLAGGFPPGFRHPEPITGESQLSYAYRVLASIDPDSAITLDLKLRSPAGIEYVAGFISAYEIKGMRAEFWPSKSQGRMLILAEISPYGGGVESFVHRARCQIGIVKDETARDSDWLSGWINVSLATEDAVRLLSYPGLGIVRVSGVFPINELARLESYYDTLSRRVYALPMDTAIPAECNSVYVNDPSLESGGSFGIAPSRTR